MSKIYREPVYDEVRSNAIGRLFGINNQEDVDPSAQDFKLVINLPRY